MVVVVFVIVEPLHKVLAQETLGHTRTGICINSHSLSYRLRKTYAKITKFSEVMAYFATREWKFDNSNTQRLFAEMCPADRKLFDFDMAALDWSDYFYSYIRGVRVYLLKVRSSNHFIIIIIFPIPKFS